MTLTQEQLDRLLVEDNLSTQADAQGESDRALRAALRSALTPSEVPALAPAVMERLGVSPLPLAESIRQAAGRAPSLWPGVAEAIGASPDGLGLREALIAEAEGEAEAEGAPEHAAGMRRRPWPLFIGAGLAAAAAAVALFFLARPAAEMIVPMAKVVVPVARVAKAVVPATLEIPGVTIIESLESETASVLQVLQFDDDAPTIIFIDDGV
jgi:hypothetical protein